MVKMPVNSQMSLIFSIPNFKRYYEIVNTQQSFLEEGAIIFFECQTNLNDALKLKMFLFSKYNRKMEKAPIFRG
jgi:hypothetical protein